MRIHPILGLSYSSIWSKEEFVVTSPNDHSSLMEEFKDCFKGLGCLPGKYKIHVDKSMPPVVHPCRTVPFAL